MPRNPLNFGAIPVNSATRKSRGEKEFETFIQKCFHEAPTGPGFLCQNIYL